MRSATPRRQPLQIVVFSGGRGSGALVRSLLARPGLSITIAINGYDDGASTGEVRRFLGDSLGPSDFRKNASRLARELQTSGSDLVALVEKRLPADITTSDAVGQLEQLAARPDVGAAIRVFLDEMERAGKPFDFGDCSIGNLVFAGVYLRAGRSFNTAVDEYAAMLGIPAGTIENVTAGENAYLVALTEDGRLLRSEGDIVDARARNRIRGVFLIDRPLSEEDARKIETASPEGAWSELLEREPRLQLNPRLAAKIAGADIIIYAPGTQHSSLFPSYMTPGLADAIASNLRAIKLLVTNLQSDAEISGSTAVDLIGRALFYLNLKAGSRIPAPCLITHYLVNEPGSGTSTPHVPLGPVDDIEDPRLMRIGNYEDGVTGEHDAARVLGPFIDTLSAPGRHDRVALLLHDAGSSNKVVQSILEMVRGGVDAIPVTVTVFYMGDALSDGGFVARLPVELRHVRDAKEFASLVAAERFDYVGLFESSGMYRGEDVVALLSHLAVGRMDAIWGSRRLSLRDIEESYRMRYRSNALLGAVSYVGSYMLSAACLLFYGRYVSDTLSGVRIVRAHYAIGAGVDLTHDRVNDHLLSALLRDKANILELPVRFVPLSPEKVRRTRVLDGLTSLMTLIKRRFAAAGSGR